MDEELDSTADDATSGDRRDVRSRRRFVPPGARPAAEDTERLTGVAGRIVAGRIARRDAGRPDAAIDEVPESEPAAVAGVFGEQVTLARAFFDDLVEHGVTLGLIGPEELPRLWSRHILNSALIAPLLRGSVADVGSGGGFPGIPCAIARPDVQFTLIEPMERRCAWLIEESERLGLTNVTVLRSRGEDVPSDLKFDTVTARAVAGLSKLIPWTAPLLRPGGRLVLQKGARAALEIEAARKAIRSHRLQDVHVVELGAEVGTDVTWVVVADVPAA